jgi:hypothetical protein
MNSPLQITNEKQYWERIDQESVIEAIKKCEDAAKQLITINSALSTIYFGVIAFNDVLKATLASSYVLVVFVIPLVFWLLSLYFSTQVIVPRRYLPTPNENQQDLSPKQLWEGIMDRKLHDLKVGYFFLIVSMLALILTIIYYVLIVPLPPASL